MCVNNELLIAALRPTRALGTGAGAGGERSGGEEEEEEEEEGGWLSRSRANASVVFARSSLVVRRSSSLNCGRDNFDPPFSPVSRARESILPPGETGGIAGKIFPK